MFDYNNRQQIVKGVNFLGNVSVAYSSNGLPDMVAYPNGHALYYGYNEWNQRTFLADNHGFNITYDYDWRYRLIAVRYANTSEAIAEWEYANHLRPVKKTLGNGGYTTYKYNPTSERLIEISNYLPNGTLLSYFVHYYDRDGHLEKLATIQGNWSYIYDAFGQLIGWTDPSGDSTEIAYDSRKNRVTITTNNVDNGYSVNNLNQYTTYADDQTFWYDRDGNLMKKMKSGGSQSFTFDAEGRLVLTETTERR